MYFKVKKSNRISFYGQKIIICPSVRFKVSSADIYIILFFCQFHRVFFFSPVFFLSVSLPKKNFHFSVILRVKRRKYAHGHLDYCTSSPKQGPLDCFNPLDLGLIQVDDQDLKNVMNSVDLTKIAL